MSSNSRAKWHHLLLGLGIVFISLGLYFYLTMPWGSGRELAFNRAVCAMLTAIFASVVWTGFQIPLLQMHRCARICGRCGYNLTGNVSGVCPECGKALQPSHGESPRSRRDAPK